MCPINDIFYDNEKALGLRRSDFYLECTSTHEYIYKKYLELLDDIDNGKLIDFEKNRIAISNCVKKNMINVHGYYNQHEGELLRYHLNFPNLSHFKSYGDDLSLLDLSKSNFIKKCSGKGIEYIGTNLEESRFVNCEFTACTFIATNLNKTVFYNCMFKECVFYKLVTRNTKFIRCDLNNIKFKNEMSNTIFYKCNICDETMKLLDKYSREEDGNFIACNYDKDTYEEK